MACSKRWRIGTMDVKSAFLQSDYIHQEVEIYGEPSADMRRLLVELIGLKEHEIMQMTKPAFGDVRAPRQWNETADKALLTDVGLLKHELDGCIYILRLVMKEDDQFTVFDMNGQSYVVDGLFGLHVDDVPLFASWLSDVHLIFTLISFFIPRSSSFSSHFYAHHPAGGCVCVYRLNRRKTSSLYYIYGRGQRDLQLWPLPMKLHTGDQVNVPALSRPGRI